MSSLLLWAQAVPPPSQMPNWLLWLLVWGEPTVTDVRWFGGPMTWMKIIGLFCLLGWAASWVVASLRVRDLWPLRRPGLIALAGALALGLGSVVLDVLQRNGRLTMPIVAGQPIGVWLGWAGGLILLVWVEAMLWSGIRRLGKKADLIVLVAIHLALALGVAVGALIQASAGARINWEMALRGGAKVGATYMGLVVLAHVTVLLAREMVTLRWRRLYSIAWQTWIEAFRRMWAPWVVLIVFVVILAFTDWFLTPGRAAELGRLYTGTLALLTSLLVTVMVAVLAPISLPQDIQQQTIYTIVSKPVRRLELVWGRLLGFMALVTFLLLVIGGISLAYLERTVGGRIEAAERDARKAAAEGREQFARLYAEQADQLRTRRSARLPVKGSLSFVDSLGKLRRLGIDVGQETRARSFVEGATPSMAIWQFGIVPDPFDPRHIRDLRVPVDRLLRRGTIEERENRLLTTRDELAAAQRRRATEARSTAASPAEINRLRDEGAALEAEVQRMIDRERDLRAQAKAEPARAAELLQQAEDLHSPPIPLEMTFSVYRTTKGVLGQPVHASITVTNPFRPELQRHQHFLPIHEYYTDRHLVPSRMLVGSKGFLEIEVQCLTPNQYLGMAEDDLYLLARQGRFWDNYLRGLLGVWLQAMVLTAIGVFAGTFLSWPVALVTTLAFFVAGQAAYGFLQQIALQSQALEGGGPFESLIRLLSHDNLQSQLSPTLSVIAAKTLDSLVLPVLSRLVYVVPNFAGLDVSNTVADGYAVTWGQVAWNLVLALGYALPFSVAGYFILKHREVAA